MEASAPPSATAVAVRPEVEALAVASLAPVVCATEVGGCGRRIFRNNADAFVCPACQCPVLQKRRRQGDVISFVETGRPRN
jgi:hypothetical protein